MSFLVFSLDSAFSLCLRSNESSSYALTRIAFLPLALSRTHSLTHMPSLPSYFYHLPFLFFRILFPFLHSHSPHSPITHSVVDH